MNKRTVCLIISFACAFLGWVSLTSYSPVAQASTRGEFNASFRRVDSQSCLYPSLCPTLTIPLTLFPPSPTSTSTSTRVSSPTRTSTIKPSPTRTLTAQPRPSSTPVPSAVIILSAGDIACGSGSTGAACKQMETSDLLLAINPQRVLVLGDNQYETGAASDFQNFYHPSWGRVKSKTSPVVGNHEYGTSGASDYFSYFGAAAGDPAKGYYSYNLGSWHLIALNSNCSRVGGCSAGSPQYNWLQSDLQAYPAACTLAYLHHPLWSSSSYATPSVQPLMQLLYDRGAELVLAGHAHNYERFARQTANGSVDALYGLREIIVGTGGRNFTSFSTIAPNSEVRNSTTFGVLKLTLASTQYTWQFVPIAGSSWSDGPVTEACHGSHS